MVSGRRSAAVLSLFCHSLWSWAAGYGGGTSIPSRLFSRMRAEHISASGWGRVGLACSAAELSWKKRMFESYGLEGLEPSDCIYTLRGTRPWRILV